ncbi:MAG: tryptophan halogenase [Burkholderiales bacterium RIFCSPHIGHO2_12_FULL_69_20]|nr:MAG: tryptophan halogenase [Burkholderiales bacterium RIFCSPHIGHO2_12_FULL_69_20]
MDNKLIDTIVIVGGGTSGWMTAAALAKVLRGKYKIQVVESDEIGTVGVGEATIPMIRRFNQVLEIDEDEFLRETQGTFKLGIEFVNWGRPGERYMHGFGVFGQDLWTVGFDQYWQRMHQAGKALDLEAYSINRMAARANKFMRAQPDLGNSPLADIVHAFHFDASLYARYLRRYSEALGVQRIEGRIVDVLLRGSNGHVDSLQLDDGRRVAGELFVDCSGFRGLLIEQTLQTGYEDWTHWLPCDRAVAVPCESVSELLPYTRSTAHQAGWQWRIPLQNRIGNGHVFCSAYISEDEATAVLMANLDGAPLAEPRTLRFATGMRRQAWNRNVVAVGLAGGFMEPLESTSIHLVQTAIARLLAFFPDRSFNPLDIDEYNRQSRFEFERIRDFIILHYHLNQREDAPFWQHCREMEIPATLQQKIDLYRAHGRIVREGSELFAEVGWLQVMHGQGLRAQGHHPLASLITEPEVAEYLDNVSGVIGKCLQVMPGHAEYVARHCAAPAARR